MIRRDHRAPDGTSRWILISQVDHAKISGELAAHWSAPGFTPIAPREELLPAMYGHDDGWAAWEQHPGIDPELGRPLNFTEMPLGESLDIWQRSIDGAARHGELAGYVVSGHFSALLRHSNQWQKIGAEHGGEAGEFLARQDAFRARALAQWQSVHGEMDASTIAAQGLKFLQFFDALSLWFCTAERHQPQTLDVPGGPPLRLSPGSAGEVGLSPWPLDRPELTLSVAGRSIPVRRYATPRALADADAMPVQLDWRLTPAG